MAKFSHATTLFLSSPLRHPSLSPSSSLSLSLFLYDADRAGLGYPKPCKHVSLNPERRVRFLARSRPVPSAGQDETKKGTRRGSRGAGARRRERGCDGRGTGTGTWRERGERESARGRARSLAQAWRCFPMPRTGTRQRGRDAASRVRRTGGSRRRGRRAPQTARLGASRSRVRATRSRRGGVRGSPRA